jgi:hypothetical protein
MQTVPYFILHIALLIRLSIADRHIKNDINIRGHDITFPTVTFSIEFSKHIHRFQEYLAYSLSAISNVELNHSKVGDMFDGRLFTFTLFLLKCDPNFLLDIDTTLVIEKCMACLDKICRLSENVELKDNFKLKDKSVNMYFINLTKKLVLQNHVDFARGNSQHEKRRHYNNTVLEVSNPMIDKYLDKPSLPYNIIRSINRTDDNPRRPVYEGKMQVDYFFW